MKNSHYWAIPVTWEMAGVVFVDKTRCPTLESAIELCNDDGSDIELPTGDYIDSSFRVSIDDPDYIRSGYNRNAPDLEVQNDAE